MIDVSIIILNYKTKDLLAACLGQTLARTGTIQTECIVVDNNSQDGSATLVRERYPTVTVKETGVNGGYARGMNVGIKHANGRYILLMNPDVQVADETIEQLVSFLDDHPDVALVGPRLRNPDGTTQLSCFRYPRFFTPLFRRSPLGRLRTSRNHLKRYLMSEWDHKENRPVDWLLGACMMVRRSALQSVGLLDERFFLYFEDTDWCRRFWKAGFQVYYLSSADARHLHRRQSAESPGVSGFLSYPTRVHIASWLKYLLKYRFHSDELFT